MTREDIIRMARQTRLLPEWVELCRKDEEALVRFADLVAAAEREACAVAGAAAAMAGQDYIGVAAAIRARETNETTTSHKEDNATTTSLQRRHITPP